MSSTGKWFHKRHKNRFFIFFYSLFTFLWSYLKNWSKTYHWLFEKTIFSDTLLDKDGNITAIDNKNETIPVEFSLQQNYPNPFNPETTINYTLPESGIIQLKIFDVLGRELKTLVNEFSGSGLHSVKWDGSSYSSGVYFCSITFKGKTLNNKMLLMK